MTSHRSALTPGLGLVLLAVVSMGACGAGDSGSIQVAVVWSGAELEPFEAVIEEFEDQPGVDFSVNVISTGDDMDGFLRARHQAGDLPEVLVLPRPRMIARYAAEGWLRPLDGDDETRPERYHSFWEELGRYRIGDATYGGIWIKASYKSLLWYDGSDETVARRIDESAFRPVIATGQGRSEWDSFRKLVTLIGGEQGRAALAVGAADSWVLTDWLENLLLARSPGTYRALAAGEARWCDDEVTSALESLATLWATEGLLPSGQRAYLMQFDESAIQVVEGESAMVLGSEVVPVLTGTDHLRAFAFPALTAEEPVLLGGDVAVATADPDRSDEARVDRLLDWLSEPESYEPWIRAGGFFSPLPGTSGYPEAIAPYAAEVIDPGPGAEFDLSDQLDETVAARLGPELQGLFVQQTFGAGPSRSARTRDAARSVARRLDLAAAAVRLDAAADEADEADVGTGLEALADELRALADPENGAGVTAGLPRLLDDLGRLAADPGAADSADRLTTLGEQLDACR